MTAVRVIPCLDIKDGRVVKGVHFEGLRDAGDPVELAKFYENEGADELVFLDITATSENRPAVCDLAARVAEQVFIPFTVGGGIRTIDDIQQALKSGADKISLNSAAIANPEFIREAAERFGAQCIVVAVDAKRSPVGGWTVHSHGGRIDTGLNVLEWISRAVELGAGEILLTSMDADGTQAGYDLELTALASSNCPKPVIASGGAGTPQHLIDAVKIGKADAVLLASIVHDRHYTIAEIKAAMADADIEVRLT